MKKVVKILLTLSFSIFAGALIFYIYRPLAEGYITAEEGVGDAATHLANVIAFRRHHPFPIMGWQGEWWAGYPMVEGYPWLHYYLIQPLLSFFKNPGVAIDYYAASFLFIYYIVCFLLLFYVSRNALAALFLSLLVVYGADSGMWLHLNAFVVFVASQFLLPLSLLLLIVARERESRRVLVLSSVVLSFSFYAHAAMTSFLIVPAILPFLIFNNQGKITRKSFIKTVKYFSLFALLSSIQVYQYLSYSLHGQDISGVGLYPLAEIPSRLLYMFSWMNPLFLPLLILLIFLLLIAKDNLYKLKPYLFSSLLVFFFFSLMVFNITGMNLVLMAERAIWAVSLTFLLLFAAVIRQLIDSKKARSIIVGATSLGLTAVYLYLTLLVKTPLLVPDVKKNKDPYASLASAGVREKVTDLEKDREPTKYDSAFEFPPLSWNQSFDNYRCDGISYNIYSSWSIWSSNPRYKGRYPAMKGLPLHWSGLVSAAEYGLLGEAGTPDNSQRALNQAVFFFDWYAIKHFEIGEGDTDLADYLRKEPLIASTEKSNTLIYHSLDEKYVGPIYAPTNVKTMAVIAPEIQYDNFIRTLSYSDFTSKRLIPIYLGSSMGSLNKENIKDFDTVFLYGYKKSLLSDKWRLLTDFVKSGGKLIIETGQKVAETQYLNLPEVFPVRATKMTVVDKPWSITVEENEITKGVKQADFSPLKTKYLPYAISEAKPENLKDWAKPVLTKDGSVVLAFGQLGEGKVAWSGINLPFHAIDNRNISETVIFANILEWFFPEREVSITDFEVSYPSPEKIVIKSNQGKGVLIKEHYNPGWSARLNGQRTKIYKAGLFLMYTPLDSSGSFTVELKYNGAPIHWVLFIMSTATLVGVIFYFITSKSPLSLIKIKRKLKFGNLEEIHY